jgi:C4-dicarboxylate transporter DctQ subunit
MQFIDRISDFSGRLAAWLFFAIGAMITYEVVARYVFISPTIWAEEMSRFFQVWAVYLAAGYVLRNKQLIRITLLIDRLPGPGRRVAELFTLAWIGIFCAIAIWKGGLIVLDSVEMGRATSTMLGVPNWMTESAVPFGCLLLLIQVLAEAIHVARGGEIDTGRIEEQM